MTNCSVQGCYKNIWSGRTLCREHIEIDTQTKITLLNEGKITKEEILTDLVSVPTLEEISQAILNGTSL